MQKVSKIPLYGMDKDSSDASVKPGFYREARNLIPAQEGLSKTSLQSVPGTTSRSNGSLPSGTNTVIGAFEDSENNRIVYFVYNSNSNHGIWYFDPNTNTHTKIIQSSYLSFTSTEKITGVASFGDNLYWTDNNGPRYIIVSKGVTGTFYDTASSNLSVQLSQYRAKPTVPPTVAVQGTTRGATVLNKDSYQFATRFIYHDNSYSDISPLSKIYAANAYPADDSYWLEGLGYIYIACRVTQAVPNDIKSIIKSIQFIYRKNGQGDYYLFKELPSTGATSYLLDFNATETASLISDVELSSIQMVPNESSNCAIVSERVINTMNEYDYSDVGSGSLTLTESTWSDVNIKQHHLPGATYTYGLVHFDRYGRTNGVVGIKNIRFTNSTASSSQSIVYNTTKTQLSWSLSGSPPSWATHYAIVRKDNVSYTSIAQFPAQPMFYKKEGDTATTGELADGGKIFHNSLQSSWTDNIYWRIPTNIPISINDKYRVRVLTNIGQTIQQEVPIEIVGNKIVTGRFGITNWSGLASSGIVMMQLEVEKTTPDDLFYEIGDIYSISGGNYGTTSGSIKGDFHSLTFGSNGGGWFYDDFVGVTGYLANKPYPSAFILSPSPTTARIYIEDTNTQVETVREERDRENSESVKLFGKLGKAIAGKYKNVDREILTTTYKSSFTLDYTKIASDNGRAFVEVFNKRTSYEPNTLSISDKYVYGSKVNGLGFFNQDNLYTVPEERTKIRKIQPISSGDLFLAIHEKTVTSLQMYSGNRILKTSDGSEIIGEDGSIIGYDRELTGGYGTIYPESIVHHKGKVFFFDAYRGEVVRYAANGLTPVGSVYGMKNYFKTKGSQFINTTNRSVKGGYDPNLDMYLITFRSGTSSEEDTVGFIDRQGEERWVSFYDFKPDAYCKINNKLFSFVSGVMHEHGVSSTYNNFYSSQYNSSLKLIANPEYSMTKIWRNIGIESNNKWTVSATNERGQATSLTEAMFKNREGAYYADWRRDSNTNLFLINGEGLPDLSDFINVGDGVHWTIGSAPVVSHPATDVSFSAIAGGAYPFLPGNTYRITYSINFGTTTGRITFWFLKDNYDFVDYFPTVSESELTGTGVINGTIDVTPSDSGGFLGVRGYNKTNSAINQTIISLSIENLTNPNMSMSGNQTPLTHGKPMKSRSMDITLTNDNTDITKIDFVDLGYINSPGHQTT